MNQVMNSYIDNFEGVWKDKMGNCLEIKVIDDYHCTVTFKSGDQETPLRRPWFNDQPAIDMIGTYDPQYGPSLDIELAEKGTGFLLSIDFDFTMSSLDNYQEIVPSIIRNEEDSFLEQYYHLLGSLNRFVKLT